MSLATIAPKIKEFKKDNIKIEQFVKKWEEEFKIKKISALSKGCLTCFNELQMLLTEFEDVKSRKKSQLNCYKTIYDFLAFIETEANEDLTILLINNSKEFSTLISAYSLYCDNIKQEYDLPDPGDASSKPPTANGRNH